ncbi:MAG: hypothetical protein K2M93_08265 [Muribaculaceae bacterium]|nr:hypothetical protein [Muribaculaceae bacterium]
MLGVFLLNSCAQEEDIVTSGSYPDGTIRFRLGGSATRKDTTRTVAEANESEVNSVLALLWNREDTSDYSVIECKPLGDDEWSLKVEKDALYYIKFVANADDATRRTLIDLPRTESGAFTTAVCDNLLREAVTEQSPDGENFLMYSNCIVVNTSVVHGAFDLGTINFTRGSARFDIVNKADNITINKITFNNRTIKGNISVPNTWASEDAWYENKNYNNLNIAGSSKEGEAGEYRHQIYSYRNYSNVDNGKLPSLTVEYTETKDGKSETRQHTVEFLDPESEGKTPLRIMGNRLYTITLTKAHKMNFEVSVSDWEAGVEFIGNNLSLNDLNIDSEEQQELNSRLMVNRFAKYHVKTLDLPTKKVEMYDHFSTDINDYSTNVNGGCYFNYDNLKKAGLLDKSSESSIIRDGEGKEYRIPTAGEALLLVPGGKAMFDINTPWPTNVDGMVTNPVSLIWNQSMSYVTYLEEKVAFNNKVENGNFIMGDINSPSDGFVSMSQIQYGKEEPTYAYYSGTSLALSTTPGTVKTGHRVIYGIRFEGTSEYAAYRWEYVVDNDKAEGYGLIKIKALPSNLKVNVCDILENEEYWSKDYIEYKLPIIGMATASSNRAYSYEGGFMISTMISKNEDIRKWQKSWACLGMWNCGFNDRVNSGLFAPLLLIRVEDTATAPAESGRPMTNE